MMIGMKTLLSLAFLATGAVCFGQNDATPTLRIDSSHIVGKVSPTLYGLMTEEINYSYDGGLYAELIRNRSMHDSTYELEHWFFVQEGESAASVSLDKSTGPNRGFEPELEAKHHKGQRCKSSGCIE
jgi:alpha-N-arabinofuranosidase